jgi:hypothetical protein
MQLHRETKRTNWRGDVVTKITVGSAVAIEDSLLWDQTSKEQVGRLASYELPGTMKVKTLTGTALASVWTQKTSFNHIKHLRIKTVFPGKNRDIVQSLTLEDAFKLYAKDFQSQLKKWLDLADLPRYTPKDKAMLEPIPGEKQRILLGTLPEVYEDQEVEAQVYLELPPMGQYQMKPVCHPEFLDDISAAQIMSSESLRENELLNEFKINPKYLVYESYHNLAQDIGWDVVHALVEKFNLYQIKANSYVFSPHFWFHDTTKIPELTLPGQVLVMEYRPEIVDCSRWEEEGDDWVAGITGEQDWLSCKHELEQDGIEAITRDTQNWYYEQETTERQQWLMYEDHSLFNEPFPAERVSKFDMTSKECRQARMNLIVELFGEAIKWCEAGQYPRYWLKQDLKNLGQKLIATESIQREIRPQTELFLYAFGHTLFWTQESCDELHQVYDRFGHQGKLNNQEEVFAPGLKVHIKETWQAGTPGQIISGLYSRIFGVRGAWERQRQEFLEQVDELRSLGDPGNFRLVGRAYNKAHLMGVFLTQEQLSEIRKLTRCLYDRFEVPQENRKDLVEQYPVSESRANDLAEEARKAQAKIELLIHELEVQATQGQARELRWLLSKAQSLALYNKGREMEALKVLVSNNGFSVELKDRLKTTEMACQDLTVSRLETWADQLDDKVRRLLDPGHDAFNCDLPMARLIYGKQNLSQQLLKLQDELGQLEQNERTEHIADMLQNLGERYDLCSTFDTCYIEDLSWSKQRALGFERELDN